MLKTQIVERAIHAKNDLPKVPEASELPAPSHVRLCKTYLAEPNMLRALNATGAWATDEATQKLEKMQALRDAWPKLDRFFNQVDEYYKARARQASDTKAAERHALRVLDELPLDTLSDKERLFITHYAGDVEEAMRFADIKPTKANKLLLLASIQLKQCKDTIDALLFAGNIASAHEILSISSDMLRDNELGPKDRLAAGALLAKAHGMLTEKIIVDQHVKIESTQVRITKNYSSDECEVIDLAPTSKLKRLTDI